MATVTVDFKEKLPYKEFTRAYGRIVAYSGEKVYARDFGFKTIKSLNVTTGSLNYIVGAEVASIDTYGNYAHIRISDAGTSGAPVQVGSANRRTLYFVAVGE